MDVGSANRHAGRTGGGWHRGIWGEGSLHHVSCAPRRFSETEPEKGRSVGGTTFLVTLHETTGYVAWASPPLNSHAYIKFCVSLAVLSLPRCAARLSWSFGMLIFAALTPACSSPPTWRCAGGLRRVRRCAAHRGGRGGQGRT